MFTKHVIELAEAYLQNRLSTTQRRMVDEHLDTCPNCARYYFNVRRLHRELGPTIQQTLGNPLPPTALRHDLRQKIYQPNPSWMRSFFLIAWRKTAHTTGTIAAMSAIVLVVFSAWRMAVPPTPVVDTASSPVPIASQLAIMRPTPTILIIAPTEQPQPSPTLSKQTHSLKDRVTVESLPLRVELTPVPTPIKLNTKPKKNSTPTPTVSTQEALPSPLGMMAFAMYDTTPSRQSYQIHLLNLDTNALQTFPLDGVSEPTLRLTDEGYRLAFRAWGNPAQALFSSNLEAQLPDRVTAFWEDGQPDWSPIENRLLYASQRESDRKWRLYTAWGDGSIETNLRREGRSPTFAPDGHRFAFESCAAPHQQCGLWLADLDTSEYGAKPFLLEPLAKTPAWHPHRETIAYVADVDSNWDIYLTNSQGSEPTRLTTDSAHDIAPTWSPDGAWLAFFSDRGGTWGIWLLHLESGHIEQAFDFGAYTLSATTDYWWDEQLSWAEATP